MISIKQICDSLGQSYKIIGSEKRWVTKASSLNNNDRDSVVFCTNYELLNKDINANVIICGIDFKKYLCMDSKTYILVENPRLGFIRVVKKFFFQPEYFSLSQQTIVETDKIGNNCKIYPNVHIYSNVQIGYNVIIYDGSVIGKAGFSSEINKDGIRETFPHIGGVIIGNYVDIGVNCIVDRGTLDNTVIGDYTKIDNLCHIAHNVIIGKKCAIIALSLIGGGVKIGDDTTISVGVIIRDGLTIGSNCLIGMGSIVTKSIGDNMVAYGNPAKEIRKNER